MPVSEVGLPALIGLGGFKPMIGTARTFSRLWGDQPMVVQDAPNGRGGGHRQASLVQVPLQGERTGVESLPGQPQGTMATIDLLAVARGLLAGRRDRGSTASRPPSR